MSDRELAEVQHSVDTFMSTHFRAQQIGRWLSRQEPEQFESTFLATNRTWLVVLDIPASDLRIYRAHSSLKLFQLT